MSSPIITAIEAKREELRERLGKLDELEAHARRVLGGEAPPHPKPEPKSKAKAKAKPPRESKPKRENSANIEASVLRELGKGAATSTALQEATGRAQSVVDRALRKLFAKGKVHHDDATPRMWALMPVVHPNGNGDHPREAWPHTEKQVRAQAVSEDQREEDREGNVKRRREGMPRGGTMLPPDPPREEEESQSTGTAERQDVGADGDETVAYTERRLRRLFGRTPATFDEAVAAIDAPRDAAETALATLVAAGDVSKMEDGRYCA